MESKELYSIQYRKNKRGQEYYRLVMPHGVCIATKMEGIGTLLQIIADSHDFIMQSYAIDEMHQERDKGNGTTQYI